MWVRCLSEGCSPTWYRPAHSPDGAAWQAGRKADGSFRTDLPTDWLVHASIALIHTCNDGVRAGRIDPGGAFRILNTSIRDLFTGTSPVERAPIDE